MKPLTTKMRKMLEVVRDFGGTGYAEIECQWGGYDTGNDSRDLHLNHMVCRNLCNALIRRGLVTESEDGVWCGPMLTDAGKLYLEKLEPVETP